MVREDELTTPLRRFFEQRVFGGGRELLLARAINEPATDDGAAVRAAALTAEIASLQQRQDNLVRELESFEPSGDDDFDLAWRSSIQARFRTVLDEQRRRKAQLADLAREIQTQPAVDLSLLDVVPQAHIDLDWLPEDRQRRVYDAFHLELRYNDLTTELDSCVTITGDTAAELAATVEAVIEQCSQSEQRATHDPGQTSHDPLWMLCVPGAGHAEHLKRPRACDGLVSSSSRSASFCGRSRRMHPSPGRLTGFDVGHRAGRRPTEVGSMVPTSCSATGALRSGD